MSPSPGAVATVVAAAPEVAVCVQQPDAPADPGMGFPVVSDKRVFPLRKIAAADWLTCNRSTLSVCEIEELSKIGIKSICWLSKLSTNDP